MHKSIIFKCERDVEILVKDYFEKKLNFSCISQLVINGKIPDIIGYNNKNDTLISIEVKLSDWKKGFYQAFVYKIFVDYSFICMPSPCFSKIKSKVKNDIDKMGIGFLEISNSNNLIQIKKMPKKNNLNPNRRNELKSKFS